MNLDFEKVPFCRKTEFEYCNRILSTIYNDDVMKVYKFNGGYSGIVEIDSAFDDIDAEADQYFIAKHNKHLYLVDTQGYNYCRYIIRLDPELEKRLLNKYTEFFESRMPKLRKIIREEINKIRKRK